MKDMVRLLMVGLALVLSLTLVACGGGGSAPAETGSEETSEEAAGGEEATDGEEGGEEAADGGEVSANLEIAAAGEQLLYDVESLMAPAGEEITVTFNNPSAINQHNFIVLNSSDEADAAAFNEEAAAAGDPYVPSDTSLIIAQTELLNPGESGTVSFGALDAGDYIYICTVPGHYEAGMWGVLTVQ